MTSQPRRELTKTRVPCTKYVSWYNLNLTYWRNPKTYMEQFITGLVPNEFSISGDIFIFSVKTFIACSIFRH